jgi:hypothetical protein
MDEYQQKQVYTSIYQHGKNSDFLKVIFDVLLTLERVTTQHLRITHVPVIRNYITFASVYPFRQQL